MSSTISRGVFHKGKISIFRERAESNRSFCGVAEENSNNGLAAYSSVLAFPLPATVGGGEQRAIVPRDPTIPRIQEMHAMEIGVRKFS